MSIQCNRSSRCQCSMCHETTGLFYFNILYRHWHHIIQTHNLHLAGTAQHHCDWLDDIRVYPRSSEHLWGTSKTCWIICNTLSYDMCMHTHTHCSNHQFSIADIRYWEQVLHLSCSFGWLIFSSFETCLISLKRHRRGTKWFDREEGVAGLADSSYLPLQGHESCSFFMEQ